MQSKVDIHHPIVKEILLNHGTLVTQTQDKILEAIMRVGFHDVPQDGFCPNFQEWLGTEFRFFPQASPHPTA
jgi:hypothetical protein